MGVPSRAVIPLDPASSILMSRWLCAQANVGRRYRARYYMRCRVYTGTPYADKGATRSTTGAGGFSQVAVPEVDESFIFKARGAQVLLDHCLAQQLSGAALTSIAKECIISNEKI